MPDLALALDDGGVLSGRLVDAFRNRHFPSGEGEARSGGRPLALCTLIERGTNELTIGRETHVLEVGDGIWIPPGRSFVARFGRSRQLAALVALVELDGAVPWTTPVRAADGTGVLAERFAETVERQGRGDGPGAAAAFQVVLAEWRRLAAGAAGEGWSPAVARALEEVRLRHGVDVGREELAKRCGLKPASLTAAVVRETGRPLRWFIDTARLERARDLIRDTDWPLKDIAAELCLDPAAFSRWFSRVGGQSPRAYAALVNRPR